jgi:hypothetical protein
MLIRCALIALLSIGSIFEVQAVNIHLGNITAEDFDQLQVGLADMPGAQLQPVQPLEVEGNEEWWIADQEDEDWSAYVVPALYVATVLGQAARTVVARPGEILPTLSLLLSAAYAGYVTHRATELAHQGRFLHQEEPLLFYFTVGSSLYSLYLLGAT